MNFVFRVLVIFLCLSLVVVGCKPQQSIIKNDSSSVTKDDIVAPLKPVLSKEQKKNYSLDFKIGQMIMMGIDDRKTLNSTDELISEIKRGMLGGVILFEKNISSENSKSTLKQFIADMQKYADVPLTISIDEEGGKVHRLKEKYGFVAMPSAAYLGNLNSVDSTFYYSQNLAALLAELGINVNFAPDVDLALNADNPVIAKVERSFGVDPMFVSKQARAFIAGQHAHGVKTAIKHFPGHGSSSTDSHYGITDVTKQWQEIELIPYKEIIKAGQCDAIMTAHIINCTLDTTCLPATLSKTIVTGLLRNKLKFDGLVFSDDMQMHAISKNYGLENALKLSIMAGIDVLVFGNNVKQTYKTNATEIHAILKKLVDDGEVSEARIDESFERIMKFKYTKAGK